MLHDEPSNTHPVDSPLSFGGAGVMDAVPAGVDPGVPADPQVFAKNIAAIAGRQPALAQHLIELEAPCPLRFVTTDENGALSAEYEGRALASRRRPLTEATRLADKIDIEAHGGLLVLGMGLGHHAGAIAQRAGDACAVVVFEPDLGLLKAVLERIDHSAWLASPCTVLVTDADNVGALTADIAGLDALLSVGIELVEHAPNAARLADASARMIRTLTSAVGAMRMHVITAMVQADVTVRNELMNLDHYVSRPGIADLKDLCAGAPAILVAAGPSLRKSMELLQDARVRERCVIIAVQTVLKPLLDAGIKPHFVTAIDYHEISKRFYEGLTPEDVEGVTLVAEARSNAAILDSFPGDIRLPRDDFLDGLLGTGPKHDGPDRGKLIAAATVAHLSYYLARYLGCDPVVLVGQDLAFTDGQYYGAGAAIHQVWSGELHPGNSLESMEWQRIVRNKGHLHRATDVLGRPVFTDDQMAAYLAQFERDFAPDEAKGLTVIDASEGVKKNHTTPMPLRAALERVLEAPALPEMPRAAQTSDSRTRCETADLVRRVRRQSKGIAKNAKECITVLEQLKDRQHDSAQNTALVERTHALRNEAQALQPAFGLLMKLNQLGGFKRFKADRAIALASHDDQLAEQRARIDRDIVNLDWIDEYACVFEELLGVCERAFAGGPKRTRDITPDERAEANDTVETVVVGAVIHECMGTRNETQTRQTIERVLKTPGVDRVVLLTDTPERFSDLKDRVDVEQCEAPDERTLRSLRAGRAWARDAWRAGLAGLSVYDEAMDPTATSAVCAKHGLDAVLIVGPDWIATDPELNARVIERHREAPNAHPITFTQAPPGLCGALVCAAAFEEMAKGRRAAKGSVFATLGGVFGYVPVAPRHDPIARPGCVQIDAALRDRALRAIADTPGGARRLGRVQHAGDAIAFSQQFEQAFREDHDTAHELVLEITTRSELPLHAADGIDMDRALAFRLIDEHAERAPGTLFSLEGDGDPMLVPWWGDAIAHARERGLLTHVRTDMLVEDAARLVLKAAPDIVSIDCHSVDRTTYAQLTGLDAHERVRSAIDTLLEERESVDGLPAIWIVPRITKRDAVYTEIEVFYDAWMTLAGAAIIDPLKAPIANERIAPLPVPRAAAERQRKRRRVVRVDGTEVTS